MAYGVCFAGSVVTGYSDLRDLHELTHSCPTRRSADLKASFGRRGPGPKLGRARSGVVPRRRRSAVEMWVDAERAQVALGEAAGQRGRGLADGIEGAARAPVGAPHPAFGRATEHQLKMGRTSCWGRVLQDGEISGVGGSFEKKRKTKHL